MDVDLSQTRPGADRFNSWKAIARHLRREVRTVQLWEKHEGLPVHRHFHNRQGTVFAYRNEIDAWFAQRATARSKVEVACVQPKSQVPNAPKPARDRVTALIDPAFGLADTLEDVARLLDPAKVEVLPAAAVDSADYILRWRAPVRPGSTTMELYSKRLGTVVLSRAFTPSGSKDISETLKAVQEIQESLWLQSVSAIKCFSGPSYIPKEGAREAYIKGRYLWSRRTEEDLRKAMTYFLTASRHDPEFALAYTGLADSLTLLSFYDILSPSDAMPKARAAALRALDLDPNLAEAHTSLADINLHFDRHLDQAGQGYRRAIECNPGYPLVYHWYANWLAATGQHDTAQFAIMRALELDPSSLITQVFGGVTSYLARRYDHAIHHYRNALELDQNYSWTHMYMAQALEQKGQFQEAINALNTAIRLTGGSNTCMSAMKAHAHAAAGERGKALEILSGLLLAPIGKCVPSYDIAATYVALGDKRQALRWLQRSCSDHNMMLFTLPQDPRFDGLRSCSEFDAVMRRVNAGEVRPQLS